MAGPSTHRGHPIIAHPSGEGWVYDDTGELVSENPNRDCGRCGLPLTDDGHDGCIPSLPGVRNACCGHGETRLAYVQFDAGDDLAGEEAVAWMRANGGAPWVERKS